MRALEREVEALSEDVASNIAAITVVDSEVQEVTDRVITIESDIEGPIALDCYKTHSNLCISVVFGMKPVQHYNDISGLQEVDDDLEERITNLEVNSGNGKQTTTKIPVELLLFPLNSLCFCNVFVF